MICVTERGTVIPCDTPPSALSVIGEPKFIAVAIVLLLTLAYTGRLWWRMWLSRRARLAGPR